MSVAARTKTVEPKGNVVEFPAARRARVCEAAAATPSPQVDDLGLTQTVQDLEAAVSSLRATHQECLSTIAFNEACQAAMACGNLELMIMARDVLARRLTVESGGRVTVAWPELLTPPSS
jgi:hypothetical protein